MLGWHLSIILPTNKSFGHESFVLRDEEEKCTKTLEVAKRKNKVHQDW